MSVTIRDNSQEVLSRLKKAKKNMLWAIGGAAEKNAKQIVKDAPRVDTGRLRNDITHKEDENATYVGTNVGYGIYVEEGTGIYASDGSGRKDPWVYKGSDGKWHFTRGMKPIHFLRRAATEYTAEYKGLGEDAYRNA